MAYTKSKKEKILYPKNRLKAARFLCGMNQEEFSKKIGIGLTSYCHKEHGSADLWLSEMIAILKVVREHDESATLDSLFYLS